jgi:hypothetical protein
MARYIQRISLLGKERWIGWEVDGIGTEIPGLTLADEMTEEELRVRGVKEFRPLPFESFVGMGAIVAAQPSGDLLEEDIEFRLDALQVGMERHRSRVITDVPRSLLVEMFGGEEPIAHPRVQQRFRDWQRAGAVEFVGREECYLRIRGRLS